MITLSELQKQLTIGKEYTLSLSRGRKYPSVDYTESGIATLQEMVAIGRATGTIQKVEVKKEKEVYIKPKLSTLLDAEGSEPTTTSIAIAKQLKLRNNDLVRTIDRYVKTGYLTCTTVSRTIDTRFEGIRKKGDYDQFYTLNEKGTIKLLCKMRNTRAEEVLDAYIDAFTYYKQKDLYARLKQADEVTDNLRLAKAGQFKTAMISIKKDMGAEINHLINTQCTFIPFKTRHKTLWKAFTDQTGKTYAGADKASYESKKEFLNWLRGYVLRNKSKCK
jgi:phage regulator Rha-like protein